MRPLILGRVILGRRVLACCGLHLHIHHHVKPLLHFDFGIDCIVVGVVGKCWGSVPIAGSVLLLHCLHTNAGMCVLSAVLLGRGHVDGWWNLIGLG